MPNKHIQYNIQGNTLVSMSKYRPVYESVCKYTSLRVKILPIPFKVAVTEPGDGDSLEQCAVTTQCRGPVIRPVLQSRIPRQ
jgi:hypothetical protein